MKQEAIIKCLLRNNNQNNITVTKNVNFTTVMKILLMVNTKK